MTSTRTRMLLFASVLGLAASPAGSQPPAAQDSTLDNLVHTQGYVTAAPGTLGAVVERGKGPIDMVLVSGFGVGASVFEGFMRRNADPATTRSTPRSGNASRTAPTGRRCRCWCATCASSMPRTCGPTWSACNRPCW